VMPSLARTYGGPVEALIGYVAAGAVVGSTALVVGPRSTSDDLQWLAAAMPGADLDAAGSVSGGSWRNAPAVMSRLRNLLATADVVHVHGLLNPVSSGAARAALRHGRSLVIGPFGTMSRYTFTHRRSMAKRLYFRAIDAPNLRRAAAIHFTTAAEQEEARWTGIDFDGRAHVVPPPFCAPAAFGAAAAGGSGSTVLFLGRLHPVKGVDVLLDAWPAVRARRPEAHLVIAGRGTARYESALRAQAAGLGRDAASIAFVGFVQGADKSARLASASAWVLPSRHENFGIAVLEAVAAGVPVVVAPGVQLAPWVASKGLGVVADRTPASVAAAVLRVLDDAAMRTRARTDGATLAVQEFGPVAVAPKLRAMYEAAVAVGVGGRTGAAR
jgi:glycosyltransferase involved in cell wall biosynthesis